MGGHGSWSWSLGWVLDCKPKQRQLWWRYASPYLALHVHSMGLGDLNTSSLSWWLEFRSWCTRDATIWFCNIDGASSKKLRLSPILKLFTGLYNTFARYLWWLLPSRPCKSRLPEQSFQFTNPMTQCSSIQYTKTMPYRPDAFLDESFEINNFYMHIHEFAIMDIHSLPWLETFQVFKEGFAAGVCFIQ